MEEIVDENSSSISRVCRIPPRMTTRTYSIGQAIRSRITPKRVGFATVICLVAILAWAPWISEDYAEDVVIDSLGGPDAYYYYLGENVTIDEIPLSSLKIPFGVIVYFPSEAAFIVTFWGGVL